MAYCSCETYSCAVGPLRRRTRLAGRLNIIDIIDTYRHRLRTHSHFIGVDPLFTSVIHETISSVVYHETVHHLEVNLLELRPTDPVRNFAVVVVWRGVIVIGTVESERKTSVAWNLQIMTKFTFQYAIQIRYSTIWFCTFTE